jgi:hypothetical protein
MYRELYNFRIGLMEYYKCAFRGALIGKQYGCQYAVEVTRRIVDGYSKSNRFAGIRL